MNSVKKYFLGKLEELFVDRYEFTMESVDVIHKKANKLATFDVFFRKVPDCRNYLISSGVRETINHLLNFHFDQESLNYFRKQGFNKELIQYLESIKFSGDFKAIPDGTPVFQETPVGVITCPIIEAQILETFVLNAFNANTMFASYASRITTACKGIPWLEFGARRAHGLQASLRAAENAIMCGALGTSLEAASFLNPNIEKAYGTMAHSFIQKANNELEAFMDFSNEYPGTIVLIDTYDIENSVYNAIKVKDKISAVRIDSGDLISISKKVRMILDSHNAEHIGIFLTNNLTPYSIEKIVNSKIIIDGFGVGTQYSSCSDRPWLDTVYKISSFEGKGGIMKWSESKVTWPGKKNVYRFYDDKGFVKEDVISLEHEILHGRQLLETYIKNGELVKKIPSLIDSRENYFKELKTLKPEFLDLNEKFFYPVNYSQGILDSAKKIGYEPREVIVV